MNLRTFTPIGWTVIAAIAVSLLVAAMLAVTAPSRRAAGEARARAVLSDTRTGSAAAATETIAVGAAREAAGDKLTLENTNAILNAPGAHQRLDPLLNRAGLDGVCRRPSARHTDRCLQHLGPVEPSQARR